jgi:DNA-directed RNA polymerase specialized sigma24 family protein
MPNANQIAPHLPFLRRFARALSGTQQSGDAYVASTLEALIEDPSIFPASLEPRVGLYKIFLRLWSSVPLNSPQRRPMAHSPGERRLDRLAPPSRQAFLLHAVEGFPIGDVASILGVSAEEAQELLAVAAREIALQIETNVLIIEDEPMIAMDIEAIAADLGHRVVGVARTHTEAVKLARDTRPGLVLADIQLADGSSGLAAVDEILRSFEVPVIFITAFPERLLTGKGPEPAFLITKPFHADSVKAAISQVLFFEKDSAVQSA